MNTPSRIQVAAQRRFHEREWVQPNRRASYYESTMAAYGTLDALAAFPRTATTVDGRVRLSHFGKLELARLRGAR